MRTEEDEAPMRGAPGRELHSWRSRPPLRAEPGLEAGEAKPGSAKFMGLLDEVLDGGEAEYGTEVPGDSRVRSPQGPKQEPQRP